MVSPHVSHTLKLNLADLSEWKREYVIMIKYLKLRTEPERIPRAFVFSLWSFCISFPQFTNFIFQIKK